MLSLRYSPSDGEVGRKLPVTCELGLGGEKLRLWFSFFFAPQGHAGLRGDVPRLPAQAVGLRPALDAAGVMWTTKRSARTVVALRCAADTAWTIAR